MHIDLNRLSCWILFSGTVLLSTKTRVMDTAYLKQSLGDCLAKCLSEVSEKRPRDPIEYIAQWLMKHVENQNLIAQVGSSP